MTVPPKAGYASCTCPGAAVARQRLDNAGIKVRDFAEFQEEHQLRRVARREAAAATRAGAAGRSRAQVREMYLAELRARDLTVPPEPVLEAVVDRLLTGQPLPAADVLSLLGREIHDKISRPRGRHARGGRDDRR